jgi:hypothetical protein
MHAQSDLGAAQQKQVRRDSFHQTHKLQAEKAYRRQRTSQAFHQNVNCKQRKHKGGNTPFSGEAARQQSNQNPCSEPPVNVHDDLQGAQKKKLGCGHFTEHAMQSASRASTKRQEKEDGPKKLTCQILLKLFIINK